MSADLLPLWRRFRATKDPAIRDTLIRETVWLVRRVAGRLAMRLPAHLELADLEAAGIPGLMAAVESYDPEKEVEFSAYAQPRIQGAILDELRSLDPLPRSLRVKARRIERAVAVLEQRLLRPPSDEEVADFLELSVAAYHQTLHELRGGLHVSLETGGAGDGGEEAAAGLPLEERSPDPWMALALKERRALLGGLIEELPAIEKLVLSLYYAEELTMKEVGAVLEVSESRVSQIHAAALLRLRTRLRRRHVGPEDLQVPRGLDAGRGVACAG
ncbi:MAG: sigma-70 family RNA polymerase sigma factor [Candidatus Methylomirabilales bacterium]